jgi:parallel beta-helix repeat protein
MHLKGEDLMKKLTSIAAGLVFTAGMTVAGTVSAKTDITSSISNQNVLYVKANSQGFADGTKQHPFSKIQDAIDKAKNHSTIQVDSGTYSEGISINKSLLLQAESGVIVDAAGLDNGITVEGQEARGSVVEGFTVNNAGIHAIWIHDSSNVLVKGNIVTENGRNKVEGKPLTLEGTSNTIVIDNEVFNNFGGGVSVLDDESQPADHNQVINNNIHDNTQGGCGVVVSSNHPGQGVAHNIVDDNIVKNGVAGIVVAANPPGTTATDNIVSKNNVSGNLLPGIIVHSNAPDQTVINTKIIGNTLSGNGIIGDPEVGLYVKTGIALLGAVNPVQKTTISNNVITDAVYSVYISNATSTAITSSNQMVGSVYTAE